MIPSIPERASLRTPSGDNTALRRTHDLRTTKGSTSQGSLKVFEEKLEKVTADEAEERAKTKALQRMPIIYQLINSAMGAELKAVKLIKARAQHAIHRRDGEIKMTVRIRYTYTKASAIITLILPVLSGVVAFGLMFGSQSQYMEKLGLDLTKKLCNSVGYCCRLGAISLPNQPAYTSKEVSGLEEM